MDEPLISSSLSVYSEQSTILADRALPLCAIETFVTNLNALVSDFSQSIPVVAISPETLHTPGG